MNKVLLRIGGVINLLFVLFHLSMGKPIGEALAVSSPETLAIVYMLNMHVAFTLLIFAYLTVFQWCGLLTIRLANIMVIAILLFWFLRAIIPISMPA